ncbi:MAG: carboxypeptidase regulatory-like domain-containing protein [Acidobacteria bacterium]|nr:carboxypeptidase regulatory-like domain-containing protein [Acidobacteriota bacterium]MCI0719662.1 carboxypeptidase regulatory-like domain-containing protein [Acidobacteriota bacterium]
MKSMLTLLCIIVTIHLSVMPMSVHAQTAAGTFTGIVTDPSKAVVPGVEVTATNQATGLTRTAITNNAGEYRLAFLPVGVYNLQTQLLGFKTQIVRDIKLEVQQTIRADFQLEIGEVGQTVNVEAQTPLLETEKTDVGTVISNQQVSTLPLNSREFMQMIYLTPFTIGAARDYRSFSAFRDTPVPSGGGARPEDSNYQVDGFENREGTFNNVSVMPAVETISEFRVQTGAADASFGRSPGAMINVVTKSGTNEFHGSLYDYLRNDVFDARPFFAAGKSPLKRNQFGGSLGGPIVKDKVLFFANYEGLRQRAGGSPTIGRVPTGDERNGLFSIPIRNPLSGEEFRKVGDKWQIPADLINPISQKLLQYWPLPNYASGGVSNWRFLSGSVPTNRDNYSFRGDYNIRSGDNLYVRYVLNDDLFSQPGRFPSQAGQQINELKAWRLGGHYNHVFNPAVVNDFGFDYMRYSEFTTNPRSFGENIYRSVGIINTLADSVPFTTGIPSIGITGYLDPGDVGGAHQFTHLYEFVNNLSWQRGSHFFKFGGSARNTDQSIFWQVVPGNTSFYNAYSGDNFADFLLGHPSYTFKAVRLQPGASNIKSFAAYFHDDWKVTPKLTINFGLRWDVEPAFESPFHDVATWDHGRGMMLLSEHTDNRGPIEAFYRDIRPDIKIGFYPQKTAYDADKNNFQPRIGMAYRLRDKTVLRVGAGVFVGAPLAALGSWDNEFAPNFLYPQWVANSTSPIITLADGRQIPTSYNPEGNAGGPESTACCGIPLTLFTRLDRSFPYPLTYQWTMGLQRQLTQTLVLEAQYLGSRTNHLLGYDNLNVANAPSPDPIQPRLPYPSFFRIMGSINGQDAWYHGLGVKVQQRHSNGLSYLASYTWSKALDTGSTLNASPEWTDPLNRWATAKGPSSFDARQRFVVSYQYELPLGRGKRFGSQISGWLDQFVGGWAVAGISSFQSGFLYSPSMRLGRVNICAGSCVARPDRAADGNLPDSQRTLGRYWDRNAFVLPDPTNPRIGNAGRNILRGPGINNWDLGIFKRFRVGENKIAEFRYETFNTFNHPQFDAPSSSTESNFFGVITSARDPRISQFVLKFLF